MAITAWDHGCTMHIKTSIYTHFKPKFKKDGYCKKEMQTYTKYQKIFIPPCSFLLCLLESWGLRATKEKEGEKRKQRELYCFFLYVQRKQKVWTVYLSAESAWRPPKQTCLRRADDFLFCLRATIHNSSNYCVFPIPWDPFAFCVGRGDLNEWRSTRLDIESSHSNIPERERSPFLKEHSLGGRANWANQLSFDHCA